MAWYGLYKGLVTNNVDPEGMHRLKAICPQIFGNTTTETAWAWPCVTPGWGELAGEIVPNPGAGIWLAFEGGDIDYPIWVGVWRVV